MKGIQTAIKHIKTAKAQFHENAKTLISGAISEFMKEHPEVEALRWTQYAPYFNDGDPCVFGVNEPSVKLVVTEASDEDPIDVDEDNDDEDNEGFLYRYELPDGHDALQADLKILESAFEEAESVMQDIFGDGVQVTIGRDGEATVNEYEHD